MCPTSVNRAGERTREGFPSLVTGLCTDDIPFLVTALDAGALDTPNSDIGGASGKGLPASGNLLNWMWMKSTRLKKWNTHSF